MERSLGLMCGAGLLPARMAAEARRQGWRVIAFAFGQVPGLDVHTDHVIPSRFSELGPVLETLRTEGVSATLFGGTFRLADAVQARHTDTASGRIVETAGSRAERALTGAVVSTLAALGIEVLDQRAFLGDWLATPGCWSERRPTEVEWSDVRQGLRLAKRFADAGIGQTVVIKHGVVAAVEALEGTTAAIRRGGDLAGTGAVAAKAVSRDNDYRFDVPAIGPDTIDAAADAGLAVVAIEAGRVGVVDREKLVRQANLAGIAVVGVDGVDFENAE